jgi:hypothetical protein
MTLKSRLVAHGLVGAGLVLGACVLWIIYSGTAGSPCVKNLRQLQSYKERWGSENDRAGNNVPAWEDIRPYMHGRTDLNCPGGGGYTLGRIDEPVTCSIGGHGHSIKLYQPASMGASRDVKKQSGTF